MKPYFIKLVIVALLFGGSLSGVAQSITEDEVGFEILKWHFHHYPNSESTAWNKLGDQALKAEFVFQDKSYATVYLKNGKRLSEEMDMTKNVPLSIVYYLDDKYGKYKVQSFKKMTNFQEEQIYYSMDLKSKDKGDESISFDEHLIPIDFALISSVD